MAGAHSSRQARSTCCLWRPGEASDRVLEEEVISPQSLLYFSPLPHTQTSLPSSSSNSSTSLLLLPRSSRDPRGRRESLAAAELPEVLM